MARNALTPKSENIDKQHVELCVEMNMAAVKDCLGDQNKKKKTIYSTVFC